MSETTESIQNDLTNLGLSWLPKDLASQVPSGGKGFGNYVLAVISIGGMYVASKSMYMKSVLTN